jgi:tRNA(fMet)-specific endonuclease VapC
VEVTRFCLDTSAYSHFKRGDPQVVSLVDAAEWIGMPTVVLGELAVGFRLGRRESSNRAGLRAFLGHPVVEVLPVTEDVAAHYADIVVELRTAGTPLPANDIWIAATAARWGAPVLTYDDHFAAIGRIATTILRTPGDGPDTDG